MTPDLIDPCQCRQAITARRLAAAFLIYGLVAVALLAINIPPFQNPDEPVHFMRAAQVADGELLGSRISMAGQDGPPRLLGGAEGDMAIALAFYRFDAIRFHPDTKAKPAMWDRPVHWSATRAMLPNANTIINPPLFYVPAAIGVAVGRLTRMTVVQTLALARVLTGVAAVAVAAAAIAAAEGAAVWLFAVVTLPMSLSQMASPSQDALMLACAALAGAALARGLAAPDRRTLPLLSFALVLVATARPPYAGLALLPLALTRMGWRPRLLAAAVVVACVLGWSGIVAGTSLSNINQANGADPAAQLARLRGDPLLLVRATWQALVLDGPGYVEQFVGRLSWFDLELPPAYHLAARVLLGVAALATLLGAKRPRAGPGGRLLVVAALLASAFGVFAAEYVTWTVPGNAVVEGVEGRYFLPLALAGAAVLPALGGPALARLRGALVLVVVAFPVVSLAVTMHAVVLRHLSWVTDPARVTDPVVWIRGSSPRMTKSWRTNPGR